MTDLGLSAKEGMLHLLLLPLAEGVQLVHLGALLAADHPDPAAVLALLDPHLPVGAVHLLRIILGDT